VIIIGKKKRKLKENFDNSVEMRIQKEKETFKSRMFNKKKNMINYLPENPAKYYKDLPFMPGLDFYRAISESTFNLDNLGTSIPDTMISMNKLTWIQWVPGAEMNTGSNKRRDNDFVLLNYAEHIKNLDISLYDRNPVDSERPVVLEK